jgi:hypothetical protein
MSNGSKPLKRMVGTRRLELLTSTVSRFALPLLTITSMGRENCEVPLHTWKTDESRAGIKG